MIFGAAWAEALGPGGAALLGRAAGRLSTALAEAYAATRRGAAPDAPRTMARALAGALGQGHDATLSCFPILDDGGRVEGVLAQAAPVAPASAATGLAGWDGSRGVRLAAERTGAALRDSEERHAFLVDLGHALRASAGVAEIESTGAGMVRDRLDAAQAWFRLAGEDAGPAAATGYAPGPPDPVGARGLAAIRRELRGGRTMVVRNAATDPRLEATERARLRDLAIGAFLACPILAEGRLVAVLGIADPAPRAWTRREIALAEAAGPRIWRERVSAAAQEALRASEERHAFLLRLSDALRPLGDAREIQAVAARLVRDRLGAARAGFALLETGRDGAGDGPAAGDGFPCVTAAVLGGQTLAVEDAASDPRLGETDRAACAANDIASFVVAPLVKAGAPRAIFAAHGPLVRRWEAREIELLEEVAERIRAAVERARAEAATRASEERFRALVTATCDGVYRMSPDWREMRKLDGAGTLGDTRAPRADWLDDHVDPADQPKVMAAIGQAIATRSVFELEHRVRRSDGTLGWTISRAVPLLDAEGAIVEWFGTASDVTERRRAEDSVRQAELRLRLAQKAAGVATFDWMIRSSGGSWSPELLDMLGFQAGTLGGSYEEWIAMIHPEDRVQATACIEAAFDTGVLEGEWRVVRQDGEILSVLVRGLIEHDGLNRPVRLTGAQMDITERLLSEDLVRHHIARIDAQIAALRRQFRSRGY